MKKLDHRVKYTKMVLQQALLKILRIKHIDKVTVKELCEEANINRGTFYLHYATPNDLLLEIEQEFFDKNMMLFSTYMQDSNESNQLAAVFTYILKNKEICQILMGKNGNPKFLEKIQEMLRNNILNDWCREFPKYRREELDYVYDYIFAGSMRLILKWLEDDTKISTTELANRLDRLGHYSHLAIAEFHNQK